MFVLWSLYKHNKLHSDLEAVQLELKDEMRTKLHMNIRAFLNNATRPAD